MPTNYSVNALEWSLEGEGGSIIRQHERQAVFSFDSPGRKEIKAKLRFPDGTVEMQVKTINVPDDVIQTSASAPFKLETTYKIYYNVPDNAEDVSLTFDPCMFLSYIEVYIVHNREEKSFSFKFPDGFPIDYFATLSFKHNGVRKVSHALFSNYRSEMNRITEL